MQTSIEGTKKLWIRVNSDDTWSATCKHHF